MTEAGRHTALLNWFEAHQVDLPWRRDRSPYVVWVSEIMLQQTQVTTVVDYFERFMARFPTLADLAAAPLDDVLKLWEGLGYYSRARNLHKAARVVVDELGGQMPDTVEGLMSLPGIGRYTAGAIASLAFGLDAPLLDGNVIRILTRWFDIPDDVTKTAVKNDLWERAETLILTGQAGAWNEGLMELGRLICTPKSPSCDDCPVSEFCQAHQHGTQHERPVKAPRKKRPHYDVTAAVIQREDGQILITQRFHDRMLGGLWEFPGGKREDGESLPDCLRRELQEELGIGIEVGDPLTTIKHSYTHFHITLYVYRCRLIEGQPQALEVADWTWTSLDAIDSYAFPVTDQQIIAVLRGAPGQLSLTLE